MKKEAKIVERMADDALKRTCLIYDERNKHVFTQGFKRAYEHLTGNELAWICKKKCSKSNCTCLENFNEKHK